MRLQILTLRTISHRFDPIILQSFEPLTGWIGPQRQGDRQPPYIWTLLGRKACKELVGECSLIPNHASNVLHIGTVLKERVGRRR